MNESKWKNGSMSKALLNKNKSEHFARIYSFVSLVTKLTAS